MYCSVVMKSFVLMENIKKKTILTFSKDPYHYGVFWSTNYTLEFVQSKDGILPSSSLLLISHSFFLLLSSSFFFSDY